MTYRPPKTFGDLLKNPHLRNSYGHCSFCKCGRPVLKYSTRHYACEPCIAERLDVELPSVKRQRLFRARLSAAARKPDATFEEVAAELAKVRP